MMKAMKYQAHLIVESVTRHDESDALTRKRPGTSSTCTLLYVLGVHSKDLVDARLHFHGPITGK
jgi:hypothetical protein